MTLEELNNILKETGYPVAYSHFKQRKTLPFITYLVEGTNNFFADDKVLLKVEQINIELYTSKKDLEAENKLENLLDKNNICYEVFEDFIAEEKVFRRTYEMEMI